MKIWQKSKEIDSGETFFMWRHRANGRFVGKIGTWLLTAFVTGILTSIVISSAGLAEIAQNMARLAFWIVLLAGVANSFLRYVYFGDEYRINQNALIHVKSSPVFEMLGRSRSFNFKYQFVPWNKVNEIKQLDNKLVLILKNDDGTIEIEMFPVLKYINYSENKTMKEKSLPGSGFNIFSDDKELDKETMQLALAKAREAKKLQSG